MAEINRVEEYRQRAEAGDPEVQYLLAWEYYTGQFVEKDSVQAISWLRILERTHPAFARFNIAKIKYMENHDSFIEDLRDDCEAGYGPSLYLMAIYSLRKVAGDKGRESAIAFFNLAFKNGHLPSRFLSWKLSRLGVWRRLLTIVPVFLSFGRSVIIATRDAREVRILT